MLIADIYDPPIRLGLSAEESIMANGLRDFYNEIRRAIFDTKVIISKRETLKGKGKDTTGAPALATALNQAFRISLESLGWSPLVAPGASASQSTVDWYKSKPSQIEYEKRSLGIGLEIQMGNNYQFNEDITRLSEAYLGDYTVAGVSIVSSDNLAKHKADRGAFFSDAKSKLDRHLTSMYAAHARRVPPIMILAIEHDAYNDDPDGYFEIQPITFSYKSGVPRAVPTSNRLTNKNDRVIRMRRKARVGK